MTDSFESLKSALADRYTIEHQLGVGGMATVYAARDLRHDRLVALKVLKPELAATLGTERFLLEIRVAANLNHPHILPLLDSGTAEATNTAVPPYRRTAFLYYSMPIVEGESLRARLNREGQLGVEATCELAKEIGGALDYAHSQGVIHRDIKPENILFHHGIPMIADFGIALAVTEAGGERLTETGISVGTPQYMSPEQVSGDRQLDARSDVYALGCVLYEALVGEPPFTGPSAMAVMARQVTDPVRPIATVRPDVPANLVSAVNRALAKVPADRFDTAGHLAVALATPEPARAPERIPSAAKQEPPRRRTIAVLPFANMSPDPENEYFSDGITDDVMSQLSKVGELKVISRTSTTRFRDTELSLREIGEQLNADVILEGTVRKAGSRVRIVAQLIDARDDTHVWNDTYDRMLTDVFEIQSEVAISIAEALEAKLSPKERREIFRKPTDDLQAYDLYLLGRHHCNKRAADDLRSAITYFEQAIERDPDYADAYAGLAEVYVFAGIGYMPMPSAEAFALAKEKALRAIQLNPDRATAHAMLGFTALTCDGDAATAERSLAHALELDSNYVQTYQWLGWCRTCVGDYAGGSEAWERALELDPLSAVITAESGWPLIYTELHERALERFQRALELDPDLALAHFCVGWALVNLGRYEEAIPALEKGLLLGGAPFWRAFLASAYSKVGQRDRAETILEELYEQAEQHGGLGVSVAVVAEALGHEDLALDSLERAYTNRDDMPLYAIQITTFLPFTSLRGHPRFQAIVDGLGFSPHDIKGERKRLLERERARKVAVAKEVREQKQHRTKQPRNSIAVLPFTNLSSDPDSEYFADGITEEVINALSQQRNMKVAARTSCFALKGLSLDAEEVGKRLKVDTVLEGSVRKAGDRLRLTVQLTNVADGFSIWSERYDRELGDVFATQDALTEAIVSRLGGQIGGAGSVPVQSHPESIEAYDLYLRGRFHWNRMTPEGYAKALKCFEGAIQIDPTYAPAYAGMASAHAYSIHIEGREASAIAAKGKAAALEAIELDERLAEAHAALGYILFAHYWDWPGAEASFDRAIRLNTNSAYAHYLYSVYFGNLGRYEEAIRESELAVDLDPLWPQAAQNLGWWYIHARRFAEGEMFLRRSLEMQPDFPLGRINLGLYLLSDRPEEGIKELELASTASGDAPIARCLLAYAYAMNSRSDRAREILNELSALAEEQYVSEVFFSIVHIGMGQYDEALAWIERGFEARTGQMVWCPSLFVFDPLREEARFVELMRRMGL